MSVNVPHNVHTDAKPRHVPHLSSARELYCNYCTCHHPRAHAVP